ncbi:MAG: hypothetical protein ABI467_14425 [Kofleriaceae bacterium]
MARRLALGGLIAIVAWLALLWICDAVVASRQATVVTERLGESLHGRATLGELDLALIRGRLGLRALAVDRDDLVGRLALDVREVDCELAPLGWALVDRGCRELAVRGVRFAVSTAALFRLQAPKRAPIHADHVVLDDARLTFSPSALLPSLGRIQISIDHAESGPTTFVTPLSWIFALETLRAHVELPAGLMVQLRYDRGVFGAAGSLFGSTPVELPLRLPVTTGYTDAHDEIQALIKLGTELAEQLVAKRAEDWVRTKL